MGAPATRLANFLHQQVGLREVVCSVCEVRRSGVREHILSEDHWRNLWTRLNDGAQIPDSERVASCKASWVQRFETPGGGAYLFNHITGAQEERRPSSAEAAESHHVESFSRVLPTDLGVSRLPEDRAGLAPLPVLPVRDGVNHEQALNSKQEWKRYMDEPARRLEYVLNWCGPRQIRCMVCATPVQNGVWIHVTSQNHWKKVWGLLHEVGQPPNLDDLCRWDMRWVEAFQTSRGEYLFNHFTGAQGTRDGPGGVVREDYPADEPAVLNLSEMVPEARPSAERCEELQQRLERATDELEALKEENRRLRGGFQAQQGPCGFDVWTWQLLIHRSAQELQEALTMRSPHGVKDGFLCEVCQTRMLDVADHIKSADHYGNLCVRMRFSMPAMERLRSGPWVQKVNYVDTAPPTASVYEC